MLQALYDQNGGKGGGGGLKLLASPFAMMDRSISGPSMCAGTAVWQCRETAGSGGGEENVAAGDRNHLPPHQTPYLGVAAIEKRQDRDYKIPKQCQFQHHKYFIVPELASLGCCQLLPRIFNCVTGFPSRSCVFLQLACEIKINGFIRNMYKWEMGLVLKWLLFEAFLCNFILSTDPSTTDDGL